MQIVEIYKPFLVKNKHKKSQTFNLAFYIYGGQLLTRSGTKKLNMDLL